MEIILDERAWCENMLSNFSIGQNPAGTLNRLAKYYYSQGFRRTGISRRLEDFILRCNPSANMMRWQEIVDSCTNQADRRPLIYIEAVYVTQAELDLIAGLSGRMIQKLMFTLICLARYRNLINPRNDSWVGYDCKDIFKMANVQMTRARQFALINDLIQLGLLQTNRVVDNVSVRVACINDQSEAVMGVTDFRNLGNQYCNHVSGGYIECEHCGLTIKSNSSAQKYCKDCANAMKRSWHSDSSCFGDGVA